MLREFPKTVQRAIVALILVGAAIPMAGAVTPAGLSEAQVGALVQRVEDRWQTVANRDYRKTWEYCTPVYRGEIKKFTNYKKAIAIVGSRNASNESIELATKAAKKLSRRGWVISSGLAKGIDSAW